jgi:hypothetical protein
VQQLVFEKKRVRYYSRFSQRTNTTGALMKYRQITPEERHLMAKLDKDGFS